MHPTYYRKKDDIIYNNKNNKYNQINTIQSVFWAFFHENDFFFHKLKNLKDIELVHEKTKKAL